MPEPELILKIALAAGVLTAFFVLTLSWPWRAPNERRRALGGTLGIAAGFWLGAWLFEIRPSWPATQDKDRLLLFIVPLVAVLEMLLALTTRKIVWLPRVLLACVVPPIVLYGSVYVDFSGSGPWSPQVGALVFAGMAAAIVFVWASLAALAERSPGGSLLLALGVAIAAAGPTIMMSGYLSGGELAIALAAAVIAAAVASWLSQTPVRSAFGLGIAIVLFASLLIAARFFGSLTDLHAALLFLAPLTCWLVEAIPGKPWLRGVLRVAVVAAVVAYPTWEAYQQFLMNSRVPANPYLNL